MSRSGPDLYESLIYINRIVVDNGKIQISLAPSQSVLIIFEQIQPGAGFSYSYSRSLSLEDLD